MHHFYLNYHRDKALYVSDFLFNKGIIKVYCRHSTIEMFNQHWEVST